MGPKGKKYRRTLETKGGTQYPGLIESQTPILRDWDHEFPSMAEKLKRSRDAELARAREYAGEVLRKAGLPDTLRLVQKHPDGTWTELPDEFRKDFWKAVENLPDGESIKTTNVATLVCAQEPAAPWPDGWENWEPDELEAYIETLPPPPVDVPAATNKRELTPEWFACKVLEAADLVEADLARGDMEAVAADWAHLVRTLDLLEFADKHELDAAIGRKKRKDGSDNGKLGGQPIKATPEVVADLQRQADDLRRSNPTRYKSALATAKRITNRHGLAVETIRRLIKRPSATPKE
jgi:hypothetical protein